MRTRSQRTRYTANIAKQEEDDTANLPKYTLTHNNKKDKWDLTNDKTDKTVKSFENKADALKGGVLKMAGGAKQDDAWERLGT